MDQFMEGLKQLSLADFYLLTGLIWVGFILLFSSSKRET